VEGVSTKALAATKRDHPLQIPNRRKPLVPGADRQAYSLTNRLISYTMQSAKTDESE